MRTSPSKQRPDLGAALEDEREGEVIRPEAAGVHPLEEEERVFGTTKDGVPPDEGVVEEARRAGGLAEEVGSGVEVSAAAVESDHLGGEEGDGTEAPKDEVGMELPALPEGGSAAVPGEEAE